MKNKRDEKRNKGLTKLVDTVVKNVYRNVMSQKNSDYAKIFQALKKYPRGGTDYIATLLVPYVEDVVEEMEKSDKELMFSDTDITYAAETAAEIMGDRVMQAYSSYQKEETNMAEAKGCGCDSEANEEQEFMFAMKRKQKLKESLMAKAMKSLHRGSASEPK